MVNNRRIKDDEKMIGVVFKRKTLDELHQVNETLGFATSQSVRLAIRDFLVKYGTRGGQV